MSDDFRGHAAGHNIGGQRTSHNTSRGDQGVFTDGDALEHSDIDTQPDTLLDCHRRIRPRAGIIRVPIRIGNQGIGATPHIFLDNDLRGTADNGTAEATIWAYVNLSAFH